MSVLKFRDVLNDSRNSGYISNSGYIFNNSTRYSVGDGYCCGGYHDKHRIEKFKFNTEQFDIISTSLISNCKNQIGFSTLENGYVTGFNIIQKMTFNNENVSSIVAVIDDYSGSGPEWSAAVTDIDNFASVNSAQNAYLVGYVVETSWSGSYTSGKNYNGKKEIFKFNFNNETTNSISQNLTHYTDSPVGVNSDGRGYILGGCTTTDADSGDTDEMHSSREISKISFSNDAVFLLSNEMISNYPTFLMRSSQSSDNGYLFGGREESAVHTSTYIQKFNFSTETCTILSSRLSEQSESFGREGLVASKYYSYVSTGTGANSTSKNVELDKFNYSNDSIVGAIRQLVNITSPLGSGTACFSPS